MKLLRHGPRGAEKPAVLDAAGNARDLTGLIPDIAGDALSPSGLALLRAIDAEQLPLVPDGTRIGPCVGGIGNFYCIGLNYSDHAAELGMPEPAEPIVFSKATSAICGPNDPLPIPDGAEKVDWEVELGAVIGTGGRNIAEADALAHVAGYAVVNDISERAWQFDHGGQWIKGKSSEAFGPIGPWLVTADDLPDPQNAHLWCDVEWRRMQAGSTSTMIFTVAQIIAHLSRFFTLCPGDVIATGTPPGVGMGQKPEPVFLRAGQEIRCGIDGLGEQRMRCVTAANS